MKECKKTVVTVAVGKPYYKQLSKNLYMSFIHWNKENDIVFQIITDNKKDFDDLNHAPKLIVTAPEDIGSHESFTSKFVLFDYSIGNQILFIDCDCLVYKDLSSTFEQFSEHNFTAIGSMIQNGEFFCDVKKTIDLLGIAAMPKFVGSIYYFNKNETTKKIFSKAIELKQRYDELGFVRLRGMENEEPLFASAMAIFGEKLKPNCGAVKADLMYYSEVIANVLTGYTKVSQPKENLTGGEVIPQTGSPAIIHFNDSYTESSAYHKEIYRLHHLNLLPIFLHLAIFMKFDIPHCLANKGKTLLRPIYHTIFGYRSIKANKRI